MLKKVIKLQNFGLFHNGTPAPIELEKITFFYAENGRGKSTFSTLLRSCSQNDSIKVLAKKTIDGTDEPEIDLLFEINGKDSLVKFSNGKWDQSIDNIIVFDSEFVEQNVYSGHEIRSEQRQALLEFALGNQAVTLKKQIDELTAKITEITRQRSNAEIKINAFSKKIPISQFIEVPLVSNALQQIENKRKRIQTIKNANILKLRSNPILSNFTLLNPTTFFDILHKKLIDIEKAAEITVRAHFAKHTYANISGIEDWVSLGQLFVRNNDCPFCGQILKGIDLIEAYKSYFNEAYVKLKQEIEKFRNDVESLLNEDKIRHLQSTISNNAACIAVWKDQLEITPPIINIDEFREAIQNLKKNALELIAQKQNQPLESCGTIIEKNSISKIINDITSTLEKYNQSITNINTSITEFKNKLLTDDSVILEEQIQQLELSIDRYKPEVIQYIQEYKNADTERAKLEKDKLNTRGQLDLVMKNTLSSYQEKINEILKRLGAGFSIEQMKSNYQGTGIPRMEYVLQIRKKTVRLGSRDDKEPYFGTVLSDGDKRSLAFAFFLAKIQADNVNIQNQILVFDDPVSSFDQNRREQTINSIAFLANQCKQLCVLSHDPYFIQKLKKAIDKKYSQKLNIRIVEIKSAHKEYSILDKCDIDAICRSAYYRHHQIIYDYVKGAYQNKEEVAKSIRPLIEGYYRRKFPIIILPEDSLGMVIKRIKETSNEDDLLFQLKEKVNVLEELNEYTSPFHHATDSNCSALDLTDGQLKSFSKLALDLIYKN